MELGELRSTSKYYKRGFRSSTTKKYDTKYAQYSTYKNTRIHMCEMFEYAAQWNRHTSDANTVTVRYNIVTKYRQSDMNFKNIAIKRQ